MSSFSPSLAPHTPFTCKLQRPNAKPSIHALPFSSFHSHIPITPSNLRSLNVRHAQQRRRLTPLFANPEPTGGDVLEEKSQGNKTGDSQGPPFLTILAGVVVFIIVSWIVGSIVTWLVGLIVSVPSSK